MIVRSLIVAAIVAFSFTPAGTAGAQDVTDVDGTADFRNPPVLTNGTYRDSIVTGETVWYAVVYTNDTPYRFEVALTDAALPTDDVSLEAEWIGPTLGTLTSGQLLDGSSSYSGGETNVWYLAVTLHTSGRLGVEYVFTLEIDGVDDAGLQPCPELPDCTFDDELATLDDELATLDDEIARLESDGPDAAISGEITALDAELAALDADVAEAETAIAAAQQREVDAEQRRADAERRQTEAEQRQATAEGRIAELCAPEQRCDTVPAPGSSTPGWAVALGALVLVGGLGRAAVAARRRFG